MERARHRGLRTAVLGAALVACLLPLAVEASPPAQPVPPNRVTLITDSVGGIIWFVHQAHPYLAAGIDTDYETRTCRKLVDPGCYAYAENPPSALDTITELGPQLGPTVVIDVGYNDVADGYGDHLDELMRALVANGVQHVVWLTLADLQGTWDEINAQIRAAADRWPQLVVADWAAVSAGEPWFLDGPHLNTLGGLELARFLRPFELAACGWACEPPRLVTTTLPDAYEGRRYEARLTARDGTPPYRWSAVSLPLGLNLTPDGRIVGVPRRAGNQLAWLRVRAQATAETAVLPLIVRPEP